MIYVDYNASGPMTERARIALDRYSGTCFANPSSPYTFARTAALALEGARERVAALLGVEPRTISFTGGGTEANATAIRGALAAHPDRDRRDIVISAVEHACVYETAKSLEREGYRLHEIPVHSDGALDLDAAKRLIGSETALVSVISAHNETGVLYPLHAIADHAHRVGALVHTDAVQAVGKIDCTGMHADLISIGMHKRGGPKGVGAFSVREGIPFEPLLRGGDQEHGRRAGTENVAGIAAAGEAMEEAHASLETYRAQISALRAHLESRVLGEIKDVQLVGANQPRLPNTSLFLVKGVESDVLLARLDGDGICASSGSACASGSAEPSRTLRALGVARVGWGALRISTGMENTRAEMDAVVDSLAALVRNVRR